MALLPARAALARVDASHLSGDFGRSATAYGKRRR